MFYHIGRIERPMPKNPAKSGLRAIFLFTWASSIPYHLVANAGFGRILTEKRGPASYIRENQIKGELWQQQR
jgi:hypothetical protein